MYLRLFFKSQNIWLWKRVSYSLHNNILWYIMYINEIQVRCCSGGTRWAVGLMNCAVSSKRHWRGGAHAQWLCLMCLWLGGGVYPFADELMAFSKNNPRDAHCTLRIIYSSARPGHAASEWCMLKSAINRGDWPTLPTDRPGSPIFQISAVFTSNGPHHASHDDYGCAREGKPLFWWRGTGWWLRYCGLWGRGETAQYK